MMFLQMRKLRRMTFKIGYYVQVFNIHFLMNIGDFFVFIES